MVLPIEQERYRPGGERERAFPPSLALAGGWGYIGLKFLKAALCNGVHVWVLDPGPVPDGVDLAQVELVNDPQTFVELPASLYHLALHPHHRMPLLQSLLSRSQRELGLTMLIEKPMVPWDRPSECDEVLQAIKASRAIALYDFLELFDPMTQLILNHWKRFKDIRITEVTLARSKDREDPAIERNYKPMQPIQYQESCHCLAFLLFLLGHAGGGLTSPLSLPVSVRAKSLPYNSPCPELFPVPVDGRCEAEIRIGETDVHLLTNFKRGAPWQKRKTMRGVADGQPFMIEADYLEGAKWLRIDGVDQGCDPHGNSCENVLAELWRLVNAGEAKSLPSGIYPDAAFSRYIYILSSLLHQSCASHETVETAALSAHQIS